MFKEFPSYDEYLRNLDIEIKKRYNYCSSEAKKWAAVLRTTFPSKEQAVVLEKYKEALKQYIVQVHNAYTFNLPLIKRGSSQFLCVTIFWL